MDIRIESARNLTPALPTSPSDFGFCVNFTERIFLQSFSQGSWHDPEIVPLEEFPKIPPTAVVFHYAQEIFEGLKAYGGSDGRIRLFRPGENVERFNLSARRMSMPEVSRSDHLEAIRTLVWEERRWIPRLPDTSLYIRPAMIATDKMLGIHSSQNYLHFILLSLAGTYFSQGSVGIAVKIETDRRRVAVGGTGEAKTGGNYAASIMVSEQAKKEGFSQVLWLDPKHGKYVEEVGAMNIFFVANEKTLVTPRLNGSILKGVTRDSILRLAPDLGYETEETSLDVEEVLKDIESGEITEVFGCGTAAVVTSVGVLGHKGELFEVGHREQGKVAKKLRQELTDIQFGRKPDPYGWIEIVT